LLQENEVYSYVKETARCLSDEAGSNLISLPQKRMSAATSLSLYPEVCFHRRKKLPAFFNLD